MSKMAKLGFWLGILPPIKRPFSSVVEVGESEKGESKLLGLRSRGEYVSCIKSAK